MANVTRLVPTRSAEVLTECQKMASERLPGSMKTVLDRVDDALFELANKADSSQRQNLYFDAMRELRLKRDVVEADFLNTFNEEFENSIDLEKATKKESMFANPLELSLVDADEVEESLAVTNFVESVRSKCKEQLYGLDQRMGYLLSEPDLTDENNPVGPKVIGAALRSACKQIEADIEVKLTLFKLFDKFAGHGIHQMYCDINEHLVKQDVLPTITNSYRPTGGGGRRTRVIIESEGDQVEATGPDVFSTLQGLMANSPGNLFGGAPRGQPGMGSGRVDYGASMGVAAGSVPGGSASGGGIPGNGLPPLDGAAGIPSGQSSTDGFGAMGGSGLVATGTAHLVDTLTLLQQGDMSPLAAGQAQALTSAQAQAGNVNVLRTLRETGAIGSVNQTDSTTLDIVSILFDYVLDDPAIPDAMKALIGRLQIPMLKVALLDKALFSKKGHPARQLLDALSAAAVGWSEIDRDEDSLYGTMESIVHRIVNEFDSDISMFEDALRELAEFLSQEDAAAEKVAAESTESLKTRERIVLAKMAVDDALNERLSELEVREFIRQFLVDYWRQLLIITHVEHGDESEVWQDQLRVVDDLVWSIQSKTTPQDRKALTEKLPTMLRCLKRGMNTLEMEPETCSKFLSMLASVHVVSVKHTEESSLAERHLMGNDDRDEPLVEECEASNDEFVKQGLARLFEQKGIDSDDLDIDLSIFDDEPEAVPEPEALSPEIMAFVEQVTELDLGDWVEFDSEDGSTMRARFTWISPATGRYLFTTRQGQKAVDTTLTGLAAQFSDGTARPVDTKPDPIFDRAIGDLMEKLESPAAG